MKKYLLLLPEFVLLGLSGYWFLDNYIGAGHFNLFAFAVFLILLLQLFLRNKYVGMVLASLISFFSLYMVLAVVSEFGDFPIIDSEAILLLSVGLLFCFLGFGSAMVMFYKFLPKVF